MLFKGSSTRSLPTSYNGKYDKHQQRAISNHSHEMKKSNSKPKPNTTTTTSISTAWWCFTIIQYILFASGSIICIYQTSELANKTKALSQTVEKRNALNEQLIERENDLRDVYENFTLFNLKSKIHRTNAYSHSHLEEYEVYTIDNEGGRKSVTDAVIVQNESVKSMKRVIQERDLKVLKEK
jgi:predicted NodU family carbamoyl transferase